MNNPYVEGKVICKEGSHKYLCFFMVPMTFFIACS